MNTAPSLRHAQTDWSSNVRIYDNDGVSTVVGTSAARPDLFEHPGVMAHLGQLEAEGHTWRMLGKEQDAVVPVGNVSSHNIEVRPPLDDEQLQALGAVMLEAHADSHNDQLAIIDNRRQLPRYMPRIDGPQLFPRAFYGAESA
ncbi:MAG TPA: hypothetical protein VFL85_04135 [Candidatus Saccharimonadales bacterium]|nr:hypothetical protein [Candidatus Saccharimonadales bacterium]